jgi:CHAP domain
MLPQGWPRVSWPTTARGRLAVLALALLTALGITGVASVNPARADTTPVVYGSNWLGGHGVNACSSSMDATCGGQTHVGGISTDWYQCVELPQRLYYLRGWYTANSGVFSGITYAYQIYDDATSLGFTRQANGSITRIDPGDMIVHTSADGSGAGHVSVVDSVSGSTVNVVEENYGSGVADTATYTLSSGTLSRTGMHIAGVVHSPKDPYLDPFTGVGSAAYEGDSLAAGHSLDSNQYLLSDDARFALILQSDGNLVLWGGTVVWQSLTSDSGATHLDMQTDGNLVLYTASNTPVWQSTGTGGSAHLVLQTDGNLVTYYDPPGSGANWQSGTGGASATNHYTTDGGDTLAEPHLLYASSQDYLLSTDKKHALLMQSDGTLVLYGPGYHVLWSQHGSGATNLTMQSDGNLVLYDGGTAEWWTGTANPPAVKVVMQNDGNLVTYNSGGSAVWWTGTSGL